MIQRSTKLRIARPTDNLEEITTMYIAGLGFTLLGKFENHNGFDVGCLEGINPLKIHNIPTYDGVNHPADRKLP